MKVGDLVKCKYTQRIGLIVGIGDWCYQVLFTEDISEENGGYLEVINENR